MGVWLYAWRYDCICYVNMYKNLWLIFFQFCECQTSKTITRILTITQFGLVFFLEKLNRFKMRNVSYAYLVTYFSSTYVK